jgi:von Willebrand factor type A domain
MSELRHFRGRGHPSSFYRAIGLVAASVAMLGTPSCGSPEQNSGDALDDSTDDIGTGFPGEGGGPSSPPDTDFNGGRDDLTEDQVDQILGSECTGWSLEGEPLPATIQLVVDTSGSMSKSPPGDDTRSKWDITREALEEAVSGLPPSVHLGLVLYPNKNVTSNGAVPGDVNACVKTESHVPIAQLGKDKSSQRTAFEEALDSASIESYTATYDAYSYALNEVLLPYEGPNKLILLLTDGAPTIGQGCTWPDEEDVVTGELWDGAGSHDAETDPIIDMIGDAYAGGIRTFLIGAPGSEESVESGTDKRPWLSEAALEGGSAPPGCTIEGPNYCHFDMTEDLDFSAALAGALQNISGQVIDECTFVVPEPPDGVEIEISSTQVVIEWGDGTSSLIGLDTEGDCTDGWQYDEDENTIVLCGETCADVKADARSRLFLSFGCTKSDVDGILK